MTETLDFGMIGELPTLLLKTYLGLFSITSSETFLSQISDEHGWLITFKRNLNDWELDRYLSLMNLLSSTSSASSSSDCII